jgi:hypothetical protein
MEIEDQYQPTLFQNVVMLTSAFLLYQAYDDPAYFR